MNCCSGCCRYVYAGLLGGKKQTIFSLVALSQDISGISARDQINKQPTNKLPLTLSLFKILNTDTHLLFIIRPPYHGSHFNESFLTPPNVCTQSHKPFFFFSLCLPAYILLLLVHFSDVPLVVFYSYIPPAFIFISLLSSCVSFLFYLSSFCDLIVILGTFFCLRRRRLFCDSPCCLFFSLDTEGLLLSFSFLSNFHAACE